MKKSKIFYGTAIILAVVAVVMIFLPQLSITATNALNENLNFVLTWQTFFGGEVFANGQRLLIVKETVLPFIGYCLVLAGALLGVFTLVCKSKGGRAAFAVFAFIFLVVGTIFIWCTVPDFKYHNETSLAGYKFTGFNMGIGSLLASIFSTASPVVLIVATIFDKD